jgi:hypothetical protein
MVPQLRDTGSKATPESHPLPLPPGPCRPVPRLSEVRDIVEQGFGYMASTGPGKEQWCAPSWAQMPFAYR